MPMPSSGLATAISRYFPWYLPQIGIILDTTVLPQDHLLWRALLIVRVRRLPHVGDLEGPELLGAGVARVPLAADVLAEVEALVAPLVIADVLQILAPTFVFVELADVGWLRPRQLVHAEVSLGD